MSKSKYEFQRNIAIIIGINDYNNGVPRLETAVPDAKELARIMQGQYQYEVHLLLDRDATGKKLEELIKCFNNKQIPFGKERGINQDDRILLYFAGHGIAFDAKEKQEGPVGYLIPQDATDNPDSYLKMQDFHNALLELPCRHLLVILDCCFSGAFYWSSINRDVVPKVKIYKQVYDHYIKYRAWQVITSTSDKQTAVDLSSRGKISIDSKVHSPFAKHLFDALNKAADLDNDGIITANDLFNYLRKQVAIETEEYKAQTPGICPLKLHENGEYVFLLESESNLENAPELDLKDSPYRGLESYEEKHQDSYFGRKEQIEQLYEKVNNSEKRALTVVLGASGTGKSSLVKAGLIPFLRKQKLQVNSDVQTWHILKPIRLGDSPLTALKNCLLQELNFTSSNPYFEQPQTDETQWVSKIFNWFGTDGQPSRAKQTHHLEKEVELLSQNLNNWFNRNSNHTLLLTIDQFEELITLQPRQQEKKPEKKQKEKNKKEEKQREKTQQELVLKWLPQVMSLYGDRLRIVLTLRSDFESQFQDSDLKKYWTEEARFHIKEMTTAELREAITEPASQKSIFFVPNTLIDKLVDEVAGMPGTLPLLSFTLNELYRLFVEDVSDTDQQNPKDDRAITEKYYEKLGGVARSLTQKAEQEYDSLVKQDKAYEQTIRRVMLRMVAVGGSELARRRVLKSELKYPEPENTRVLEVVKTFVKARLLVEGKNTEDEPYVEPAHDALVRGWERLLKWKQEEEENLILQRQLTPAAVEWKIERSESKGYLWHNNPRLDLLKKELKCDDKWFNELEAEFVQCSVDHKNFMTNVVRFLTGTVIVSLSALTFWAFTEQRKTIIGQMNTLRESSESDLRSNSLTLDALLNSLKAAKLTKHWLLQLFPPDETLKNEVTRNLRKAFYTVKEDKRWSLPLDWTIHDVSVTSDGKPLLAITKDRDTVLCIWSVKGESCDEEHKIFVKIAENSPDGIKFSPDGQRLIVTSQAGEGKITVRLWDWINNRIQQLPASLKGEFLTVTFNPKKRELAIVDAEIPYLWNLKNNQLSLLSGNRTNVKGVQFNSNGDLLLATEAENKEGTTHTINLWLYNRASYKNIGTLAVPNAVDKAIISTDNQRVIIIYGSATRFGAGSLLWTVGQNVERKEWQSLDQDLTVSFSQDGQQLTTSGSSGTISLRDWSGHKEANLNGHQGLLSRISFNQDGRLLLTAGSDGTIRLWNMKGQHLTSVESSQDFSPYSSQSLVVEVEGDKCKQNEVFESKNSKLLGFYIDKSDTMRETVDLWNCSSNKLFASVLVGQDYIKEQKTINLSSDASLIAIGRTDGMVGLWDFQGSKLVEYKANLDQIGNLLISPDGSIITIFNENKDKKEVWQIGGLDELFAKGCDRVREYLNNHSNNLSDSDRHLCDGISSSEKLGEISIGDKILVPTLTNPDKQAGVEAIAAGDFTTAIKHLENSLKRNLNDAEARIYLNNARIGNQKSYTIAVSVPISTDVNGSLEILRGVAQAQELFNKWAKTTNGQEVPFKLLIADDRNDPKVAQEIAKKLAENPDILGVIGHFSSGVTREAAKVYNDKKLAAISPVSTSVKLSDSLGKYVFRTVPNDKVAAEKLADYTLKSLNKKKAVLFYNSQSEYSQSLRSEFKSAFASQGGQVVKENEVDLSNQNFAPTKILEKIDENTALVFLADNSKLNQLFQIVKTNNGKSPILAGDDVYGTQILEFFHKQKLQNSHLVIAIPWHIKNNRDSSFSTASKGLWRDRDINWRTVTAYDAAKALMAAIKQNPKREEVAKTIRGQAKKFIADGAIEKVEFDRGERKSNIIQIVKVVKSNSKSRSGYDYEFVPVDKNTSLNQGNQPNHSK
ncbi:MAG TPA: ABC transporter substrate-binding protein [Leptolyngbyaceae cyanobacterium]